MIVLMPARFTPSSWERCWMRRSIEMSRRE